MFERRGSQNHSNGLDLICISSISAASANVLRAEFPCLIFPNGKMKAMHFFHLPLSVSC